MSLIGRWLQMGTWHESSGPTPSLPETLENKKGAGDRFHSKIFR